MRSPRFGVSRLLGIALALVVLASCTSKRWDTSEINDQTPTTLKQYSRDDAGLTESLTDYLSTRDSDLNEWAAPEDQAECAATRLVGRLGSEHLLELGFDPQTPSLALIYPDDERAGVINILTGCISFGDGILELFSAYQKLPLPESNCMSEGIVRLELDRDLAASLVDAAEPDPFANDYRFGSGLADIAAQCLSEADLVPGAALPPLPDAKTTFGSTSTTSVPKSSGDLEGIAPGGPLDTSSVITEPQG